MNTFELYDRVRIANIDDQSFPSAIGKNGVVSAILGGNTSDPNGVLYDVIIDGRRYACWARELEPYDPDDLFADDYVPARDREQVTIDQIMDRLFNEDDETTRKRHAKHTRKPRTEGPEAKVLKRIREHLKKHYDARVLRTNAGHIRDEAGNVINLGDPGQSDLHALIPIQIGDFVFGIFMAIECKAGKNTATDLQRAYLQNVTARGGIGVVAYDVLDVDTAISFKVTELHQFIAKQHST